MDFIFGRHLSRRTFLRGAGATVGLPLLDAMIPTRLMARGNAAADPARLVCIEMVHGAAGSNELGAGLNLWSPAEVGRGFDLSPSSLKPLDGFRDYMTIVSNTDVRMAEAFDPREIGGDHFRSSAVFLTQAHPRQTEGSDIYVGESLDQTYAKRYGQDTPIPSMQLCIENVDQSGGCAPHDPRSPGGLRPDVRSRGHRRAAGTAPPHGPEHPGLDRGRGGGPQA